MHAFVTVRDPRVSNPAIRSPRVVGRGAPQDVTDLACAVIAIFGPTASGKSAVAHELATRLGTEVVSADALQVYTGIPILTNQPDTPTRLTGFRALSDEMSVGEYAALAHAEIDDLVLTRGSAVVAGGTGLYLRAALAELAIPPAVDPSRRVAVERRYDDDPDAAYGRLVQLDHAAASRLHVNDRRRVVRALELAESGASLVPKADELWSTSSRLPTLLVGLELSKEELERRIRVRAEDMVRRGAVEEARAAMAGAISRTAAKALGLSTLATRPLPEATEELVLRTRRYAASQRKWMRRIPGIRLVDADRMPEAIVDDVLDLARAR